MNLKPYWDALWRQLEIQGAKRGRDEMYHDLVRRYSEPHRRYHGLAHILYGIEHADLVVAPRSYDAMVLLLAWWFHDAVYHIGGTDNELASAELLIDQMSHTGLTRAVIEAAQQLVLVTMTHEPSTSLESAMVDLDLRILGDTPERYDTYRQDIRREYSMIPDALYYSVRVDRFLVPFLAREQIYHTPMVRARYETIARANLEWELEMCREIVEER
jgi:predicted metal-dependent HD superfamily phosphohydrolase